MSERQRKLLLDSSSIELSHSDEEESKGGLESLRESTNGQNPASNKKQYSVTTDEVRTRFI